MPYVSPHYRRNGSYVRGHNRRSTPRAARESGQVWVSAYNRTDGSRVRGHWRNASTAPTTNSRSLGSWAAIPIGLILFLIVLGILSN